MTVTDWKYGPKHGSEKRELQIPTFEDTISPHYLR